VPGLLLCVDIVVGDADTEDIEDDVGLGKGDDDCVPSSPRLCSSRSTT